jgi:hypothetical protein
MYRVIELTREEQVDILMGCEKEELVSMVIECNKLLPIAVNSTYPSQVSNNIILSHYKEEYSGFESIPHKVFTMKS